LKFKYSWRRGRATSTRSLINITGAPHHHYPRATTFYEEQLNLSIESAHYDLQAPQLRSMASSPFTRSSRKEGLSTRSSTRINVAIPPGNHNRQQSNIGRKKRARDSPDHDEQVKKKARIAIEIPSQPRALPKTRSLVIKSNAKPAVVPQRSESPKHVGPTASTQTEEVPHLPTPSPPRKPVIHHEKVHNGIKHQFSPLQPAVAELKKDEKRKLRSQEGTRFKSELSAYFPEYDEVIGNEPKEERKYTL
jgi:hypothetical protein